MSRRPLPLGLYCCDVPEATYMSIGKHGLVLVAFMDPF